MAASNSPVMVQMLVVLQHSLLLVKENVSAKARLKFRHSQCEVCQKKSCCDGRHMATIRTKQWRDIAHVMSPNL